MEFPGGKAVPWSLFVGSIALLWSYKARSEKARQAPIPPSSPRPKGLEHITDYLANEFKTQVGSPTAGSRRKERCSLVDEGEVPATYRKHRATIMDYDLDPYDYSDDELCEFIVAMFYFYNIAQIFSIPEDRLRCFVSRVRESYRPPSEVIFHNFKHVFNVTHMTFQMLICGVDQKLTAFDVFALLVAALCHDIDHPGVNNHFMISSANSLAILYANDSVLERHHAHKTQIMLAAVEEKASSTSLSRDEWDILVGLTKADRDSFIGIVVHAILATDMTHHMKKVDFFVTHSKREVPFADCHNSTDEQRKELLRSILHTTDIGAQTQSTSVAVRWGNTVGREFSAQYQKELSLGMTPSLIMADLDDARKLALLQSEFIASIILPLWAAVAVCFPKVQPRVQQLHKNLEHYLAVRNTCQNDDS